jgi:hypothetical protein
MALYVFGQKAIWSLNVTSFEQANIKERGDLQRLLRDRIDIIVPDGMVLAEEFGDWIDARRRIDLLMLDKEANLVVAELKRTDDGGHMELQAIRYAAMVSTMTFQQAVDAHQRYLKGRDSAGDAREAILRFLGWESERERRFGERVRIVLVAADFSREITTAALWLNERGLDIECIRLKPYEMDGKIVADVQKLIPLPEAADYMIRVGHKIRTEQRAGSSTWNLATFLEDMSKNCNPQTVLLAKTIYEWGQQEFPEVRFGNGEEVGAFGPSLAVGSPSLFVVRSDGKLTIRFVYLKPKQWGWDRDVLITFAKKLNEIPLGAKFADEDLGGKPRRDLQLLINPSHLKQFQEAILWLRDQSNAATINLPSSLGHVV